MGDNKDFSKNEACYDGQILHGAGSFLCNLKGKYITIVKPEGGYLTLCEVKAYSSVVNKVETRGIIHSGNILDQPGIVATQSSTAYGGKASLAIDGNIDGNYWHRSCEHSGRDERNTWWQVDMLDNYYVEIVEIFNR